MSELLDRARRRILATDGATEVPAAPAAVDVGALSGYGVGLPAGVIIGIYEFATWADANEAALDWRDRDGEEGLLWRAATNGAILLAGRAPDNEDDDYAARFALNSLISSFAGEE